MRLFNNKITIVESSRPRSNDNGKVRVYGRAYVDKTFEVGSVWVDRYGNFYLEQSSKSIRVHGRFPRVTARSTRELAREIRKEFANLCAK